MSRACDAYLLHDTGLALGEGDVTARLVLDELDLNLATLAAALLVVIVVVVGSITGASALGATGLYGAIAVLELVVVVIIGGGIVNDVGRHIDVGQCRESLCFFG